MHYARDDRALSIARVIAQRDVASEIFEARAIRL
jgi:hypothetical protein